MNKKIAQSLGMEIPDEDSMQDDIKRVKALTTVKPHEIVTLNNPSLPNMADIDIRLAEGEKQLEEVIVNGLAQMTKMFEKSVDAAPDKVARYLEVAQMMMAQTLSAIMHKNKLQLEKKKMRMNESSYGDNKKEPSNTTNNNLFMSREDAMDYLEKAINTETR